MSEPPDEDLLLAYRNGDARSFRTLFERYRNPLFNFILRRVKDPALAEELYQDVWIRVIESGDRFRGDAKFSTWIYTIARNRCIDRSRRSKNRIHRSLDSPQTDSGRPLIEAVRASAPSTDDLATASSIKERIARAVEELPEEQQEVFLMRQLQGLGFQEISDVVRAPVNTVKSRMRYALERLRHELGDLGEAAR
ncbi:MAG: RNA polymerase sigma factor [Myxococcota bacterium]